MLMLKNVKAMDGRISDVQLPSEMDDTLDANGLLWIPGVIDSHISLGVSGRQGWKSAVESAMNGGVTAVIDIFSAPAVNGVDQEWVQKKHLVEYDLGEMGLPLRYYMYGTIGLEGSEEMGLVKGAIVSGLMLPAPGHHELGESLWDRAFQTAAWADIPVAVDIGNEDLWFEKKRPQGGMGLLEKAIHHAEKSSVRLYILNVARLEELHLIEKARARSLLIYAETTPKHLFPVDASEADFLWEAIGAGKIEVVGSGYRAEEPSKERFLFGGMDFDFANPLFLLPLLLTAYCEGKITLEKIVSVTRANLYDIFELDTSEQGSVLVNLDEERSGRRADVRGVSSITLKGWPAYTIAKGRVLDFVKF